MFTLGGEGVSSGMTCGVLLGSCGELMGVEGIYPFSFSIRIVEGGDNVLEEVIWTGAEITGRGFTGAGRSGGGVAVVRALLKIVWK